MLGKALTPQCSIIQLKMGFSFRSVQLSPSIGPQDSSPTVQVNATTILFYLHSDPHPCRETAQVVLHVAATSRCWQSAFDKTPYGQHMTNLPMFFTSASRWGGHLLIADRFFGSPARNFLCCGSLI